MTLAIVVTGAVTTAVLVTRDQDLLQGDTLVMLTQPGLSTPGTRGREARILPGKPEVDKSSPERQLNTQVRMSVR